MFEGNKTSGNVTGGMDAHDRWEKIREAELDEAEKQKKREEEERKKPTVSKLVKKAAEGILTEELEEQEDDQGGFRDSKEMADYFRSLRDTSK